MEHGMERGMKFGNWIMIYINIYKLNFSCPEDVAVQGLCCQAVLIDHRIYLILTYIVLSLTQPINSVGLSLAKHAWLKLDLQVGILHVAPLVITGRLHLLN